MSNYPPGVTGNEYEIAGPDREFTDERECDHCDRLVTVDVVQYRWEEWWTCPACGGDNQRVNEPDFPDLPDDIPDWWDE